MSDCRLSACATKTSGCEVCRKVEKMTYTAHREGLRESYQRKTTYSGVAAYCPKCGRRLAEVVE